MRVYGITYKRSFFIIHQPYEQAVSKLLRATTNTLKQIAYPELIVEFYMIYFKKYCAFFTKHKPMQVPAYIQLLDCLTMYSRIKPSEKTKNNQFFLLCELCHSILSTDIF